MDKNQIERILNADEAFFKALYTMRVLSSDMAEKYFHVSKRKINKLIKLGLISHRSWDSLHYYVLNKTGITYIRKYCRYWGYKKQPLSKVLVNDKKLMHQLALNSFALRAMTECGKGITYYDQKFMPSQLEYAIPDGLIEAEDEIYLLEMDMNTEGSSSLAKKWESYRMFLSYNGTDYFHDKPVTCLFILENVINADKRRDFVMKSIAENILDMLCDRFQICIGTSEELLKKLNETGFINEENEVQILQTKFGFSIVKNPLFSKNYGYYIRKLTEKGRVISQSGQLQEYLIDVQAKDSALVFRNIYYFASDQGRIYFETGRNLLYIVIVSDFAEICKMLNLFKQSIPEDVYFTTGDLLKERAFEYALCRAEWDAAKKTYCMNPVHSSLSW